MRHSCGSLELERSMMTGTLTVLMLSCVWWDTKDERLSDESMNAER
jgi:hypothetical protein